MLMLRKQISPNDLLYPELAPEDHDISYIIEIYIHGAMCLLYFIHNLDLKHFSYCPMRMSEQNTKTKPKQTNQMCALI